MAPKDLVRSMRMAIAAAAIVALIAPGTANARSYGSRTLAKGSSGSDVKLLQRYLTRAGFRARVDGRYGGHTLCAERRFERKAGRRPDGWASRSDQRVVREAARRATLTAPNGTGGGIRRRRSSKATPALPQSSAPTAEPQSRRTARRHRSSRPSRQPIRSPASRIAMGAATEGSKIRDTTARGR